MKKTIRLALLFAVICVQTAVSTPAISKYDLNADFVDASLSRLQPERELSPSRVEYASRVEPIRTRETHSEADGDESEPPSFEDANDEENEIDSEEAEDGGDLFEGNETDDEEAAAAQPPEDTPEMREVLYSFMSLVPNNTLLSQLLQKAAHEIILSDEAPLNVSHNSTAKSHS